jgi:hypothetical protein
VTDDWAVLSDGSIALVRGSDYHIDWIRPGGARTSTPKMPFDWRRVTTEDKQRLLDSTRKFWDDPKLFPIPNRQPARVVDPDDLPDYYPPVRVGQTRADRDGNLWILPTTSTLASAGLVYDVVNKEGQIFQRVALPPQRDIVGFGPGGVVYLLSSGGGGRAIERTRILR